MKKILGTFVGFLISFLIPARAAAQRCDVEAIGALPGITFQGAGVRLSLDMQSLLAPVAARLRNNPNCRLVVVGYCQSTKSETQRSWDRVNAVINYLVEREGISADRFIFLYNQEGGDCNTVDLRAAAPGEEGPSKPPAPHPNLRRLDLRDFSAKPVDTSRIRRSQFPKNKSAPKRNTPAGSEPAKKPQPKRS